MESNPKWQIRYVERVRKKRRVLDSIVIWCRIGKAFTTTNLTVTTHFYKNYKAIYKTEKLHLSFKIFLFIAGSMDWTILMKRLAECMEDIIVVEFKRGTVVLE